MSSDLSLRPVHSATRLLVMLLSTDLWRGQKVGLASIDPWASRNPCIDRYGTATPSLPSGFFKKRNYLCGQSQDISTYVYTYFYLRSYVASTILVGLATYVGLGCGADRSDYDITIPHFLNDTGVKAFCSLGPPGGGPFGRPLLLHHLAT